MNKLMIFVVLLQHVLSKRDNTWWKHTTLYEVYLPSFKDSNGDGLGDLAGKQVRSMVVIMSFRVIHW